MTFSEVFVYVKSDLFRYSGKLSLKSFLRHYFFNRSFRYSFWFRLAKSDSLLARSVARVVHFMLTRKFGIQIPVNTEVGYGLYIGHGMSLVVNQTARIGNNVNLSQFTTIGSNHENAAIIGDEVYLGPNVCVVENVNIGSMATIGAGAVVTRSIPEGATAAGVPAKVISYSFPGRYIHNRWPL